MVPLLLLLILGGAAAAPTPEAVFRQAEAAVKSPQGRGLALDGLKRFRDSDDPWIWRLRALGANHLVRAGDAAGALRILERPFPASLRGTAAEVKYLESMAYAAHRLRRPDANALIERAYVLAKAKHPALVPTTLVMRTIVDPENTPRWAVEAARTARQINNSEDELRANGQLGLYYANRERFDEAIAVWEPTLDRAIKLKDVSTVHRTQGNLGWGYLELGDYELAGELFAQAHANARRMGDASVVVWTYQLGNVRLQQGDLAGAGKQYAEALRLAEATKHEQQPVILANLAQHALLTGDVARAQRYADQSLQSAKDVDDQLRARLIAGRIATAAGKFDEAERLLKDVLARSKDSIATRSEAHGRLAQLYVKRGDATAAKREFRLSVKDAQEARASIDDMQLRFSFFTAVSELFDSYVDFHMARGELAEAMAVAEASRAQTLEEAMPDARKTRDVRTIARETGATILCYWLGAARSYLWIVTPLKIDSVALPPKRVIESAIDVYKRDLQQGPRGTLALSGARGSDLWDMLVKPAMKSIPPRSRVIVVPHGGLHAFNMETLVVPSPRQHYWIDDVVISTTASLGLLVHEARNPVAAPRLLIVGNPPSPSKEFVPLPRAGPEIQSVRRYFGRDRSVVLEGAKATPSAYRNSGPEQFAFLHFVAHGVASRQKPLDSAIILANEGGNYKLYARDIVRQPLHATLVTISSCHGAGNRTYAGEGLVGLGWAFLRAGADNVVAALWEVSDDATQRLMNKFYERIAAGADPATALRDAKLHLKAGGGVYSKPMYWAPFLLYGNS
jgi:CHAT domain-containing protein